MSASSILIIGGTSQVGIAIAKKFSKNNFDVLLSARDISSLTSVKDEIESEFRNKCQLIEFDVLELTKHEEFYEKIIYQVEKFNNINKKNNEVKIVPDVIVSVVGKQIIKKKSNIFYNEIKDEMMTNYVAPAMLIELFSNKLVKFNMPITIIGISSVAGERGRSSNYVYGSAKSGLTQFLSGLRQKLVRTNIRVVTVIPGYIQTKMLQNISNSKFITSSVEQVANLVFSSYKSRLDIVYTRYWRIIMLIIKLIPESLFKKLKL